MSDVDFTGSESLEELEAKLKLIVGDEDVSIDDGHVPAPLAQQTPKTGDNAEHATTAAEPDPSAAGDVSATPPPGGGVRPTVLARDGVNPIPYSVLESTRERARQAEERVHQLSAEAAKVQLLEQELAALKQRAVEAGADASLLTEDGLTDEQLAELAEEYPPLGRHLRALTQKINELSYAPVATAETLPVVNPVDVALTHTPDLDEWRVSDRDRWELALVIDRQLQTDPAFTDKSLVQRFREVERRVKAEFGDTQAVDAQAQAAGKVADAARALPGSPSDVGSTVTHTPDRAAQIAAMEGNAQLHSMDGMSDAEIDALLTDLNL